MSTKGGNQEGRAKETMRSCGGKTYCKHWNSGPKGCKIKGGKCDVHKCNAKDEDGNVCGGDHRSVWCVNKRVPKA